MRNMLKKEFLLMFRTSKWIILAWGVFQVLIPVVLVRETANLIQDQATLNRLFVQMLVFYPMMTIPVVCVLVFTGGVNEERRQGILMILLANGVKQEQIWRGKLIASLIVSEGISLLVEGVTLFLLRMINGFWLSFSLKEAIFLLFLVPFVAMVISGVLCLVLWGFQHGQLFATMIPYLLFFGCCFTSVFKVNLIEKVSLLLGLGIFSAGVIVVIISERLVALFSNEHIVNLGRL